MARKRKYDAKFFGEIHNNRRNKGLWSEESDELSDNIVTPKKGVGICKADNRYLNDKNEGAV